MTEWWESLSGVLQVLYCIAVPATLLLVIQTILTLVGFGDGGPDVNVSDTSGIDFGGDASGADLSVDTDGFDGLDAGADDASGGSADIGTLRLFTFQGIMALLTTFAWVAIWLVKGDMQLIPAFVISGLCGVAMMYLVAKLLQWSAKLAENGTFNIKSTIGENAQVYVTIPAGGENGGKVTLTMQSGFAELAAVTQGTQSIPAGTTVRIVDVIGDTVVVENELS